MQASKGEEDYFGWEVFEDLATDSTMNSDNYSSHRSVENLVSEIKTLGYNTNGKCNEHFPRDILSS